MPRKVMVMGLAIPVTKGLRTPFSTFRMALDLLSETKRVPLVGSTARPRGLLMP
ncbi:hypothetical protein D3C80_1967680 [compost metagenome]